MSAFVQVMTTIDSQPAAEQLARELVTRRLAGCVQIDGPITSVYRWQGQVESATEWRCTAKTTAERYAAVEAAMRELHSYAEPEILSLPIAEGSSTYLSWLAEQVL